MQKKLASLLLTLVMVLGLATTVFAQSVQTGKGGPATITVNNASKGVTYTVYKIFNATYNTETGSIVYTYDGTLPENSYFQQDSVTGAISATDAAKDADGNLNEAATKWVMDNLTGTAIASVESDGSKLTFTGLEYGYYLVTSTHGALVAVNSTMPNAVMNDKNAETPSWDPDQPGGGKAIVIGDTTADTIDANISDTVTFRLSIITQNFTDENENPIAYYTIGDTFPEGQDFIEIKSVTVDGTAVSYTATDGGFPITVKWADDSGKSLYTAGAKLVVTYTAKLNDKAIIDGTGNVNTATFTYGFRNPEDPNNPTPIRKTEEDTATTYTYALGFKKVDDKGNVLSGATFALPFKVSKVTGATNTYVVDETGSNTVTTDDTGLIIIKGVKAGTYSIKETAAPVGYNKLNEAFAVPAAKTGSSTTTTTITKYLNEKGEVINEETDTKVTYEVGNIAITDLGVVVNKTGVVLPSTGGIGTTIFFVLGSIFVVGSAALLVVKKRMSMNG